MSVKTRKNMDMIEVPLMAETLERFFDTFIVEDENAKVGSHQVYSLYKRMCEEWSCDVYPYLTFQYFLKKRYPIHQQKKPKQRQSFRSPYIYGIKVSIVIEFDLSRPWSWIPKGYYVLRKTTKGVTISRNHSHPEVTKKRVPTFDIMLMKNGKWDLRYCNVCVNMLKIKDYLKNYTMTKAGVKEITDMVESLPVCVDLLAEDEAEPKPISDYRPYAKVRFLANRMIQMNFVEEGIDNRSKDVYRLDICHSTTTSLLILLHVNPHVKVKLLPFNKRKGTGWKIVNLSESESLCTPVFESDVESRTETGAKQELKKIITSRSRRMKKKKIAGNKPKGSESKKVGKRKLDVKSNSHVERIKKPKCNSTSNKSNKVASASGLWMSNVVNGQQKSTGGDLQVKFLSQGFVILPKTSESEKQTENENSENTMVTEDVEGSLDLPQVVESMDVDSDSTEQLDNITIKQEPDSEDEMDKDCSDNAVISHPVADIKQEIEEESLPLLLTCTSENFNQSPHSQIENSASCFSSSLVEKFPIKSECSSPSLHFHEGSASAHDLSENKSALSENQPSLATSEIPASECQEGFCEISESQICSQVVHQSISDIILKSHNPTRLIDHHSMTEDHNSTMDTNQSMSEGHTSTLDVNQFMSVEFPLLTKRCNVDSRKEPSDGVKEGLKKMITSRVRGKIPTCSNPSTLSNTTATMNSGMPTLRNLLASKNSVVSIGTFLPVDKPDTQTENPVQVYKYTLLSVKNPSALIKHSDNSAKICSIPAKAVSRSDDVMIMKDAQTCTETENGESNNDASFQNRTQNPTDITTDIVPGQTQQNRMVYKLDARNRSSETLEIDVASTKFKEHFLSQICNITKDTNMTFKNHGNTVPLVGDTLVSGEVNQSPQTHRNLPNFVTEYITQPQVNMSQNKPVNIATLSIPLTSVHQDIDICSGSSCGQVSVETIPSALCTPLEKSSEHSGVKIENDCGSSDFSNKQGQTFVLPINPDPQTNLVERSRFDGVLDKQNHSIGSVDSANSNTQDKCENAVTSSSLLTSTRVQSSHEMDQSTVHSQLYSVPSSESLLKSSPFDSTNSSDYDYTSSEEDEKTETRNNRNSLDCEGKKDSSVVMVAVEHDVFETDKGKTKPVENLQDYRLKTSDIKLENGEINLDISNPEMGTRPDTQVVKVLNSTNKVLNVLIDGSSRSIAPLSLQSYMNYSTSQISNLNQNKNLHPVIKTENDDISQYGVKSNIAPNGLQSNCTLRTNTHHSGKIFHMVPSNLDTNTVISDQIGQSENKADILTPCFVSSDTIRSCGNNGNISESENQNTPISSSFGTENVRLHNVSSSSFNPVGIMTSSSAPFGTIGDFSRFYHAGSDVLGQNSDMEYAEEIVKMSKSKDIKRFQNLNMKLQRQIPYDFLKVRIPREIYMDPCLNRPSFVVLERPQRIGNMLICKSKSDCNRLCRNQTIKKYKEIPIDIHLS